MLGWLSGAVCRRKDGALGLLDATFASLIKLAWTSGFGARGVLQND